MTAHHEQDAAARVREKQARERARLQAMQEAQRRLDRLDQRRVLKALKAREEKIKRDGQALLARLDHEWAQDQQRRTPHPELTPGFSRSLPTDPKHDYDQKRSAYEQARETALTALAERHHEVRAQRRETIIAFRRANRNRETHFTHLREALKEKQRKSFERAVKKERARDASSKGREVFARSSARGGSHNDRGR